MSTYAAGTLVSRVQIVMPTLTLGAVDPYGVEWYLETLEGWDSPPTNGDATQRFRSDGAWATPWTYASRQINIGGVAIAASPGGRENAEDRLFAAFDVADQTMIVDRDLAPRQVTVRQNGGITRQLLNTYTFRWSVSLVALDPYRYGTEEKLLVTNLPTYTGGAPMPVTSFPMTIGSVSNPGIMVAANTGTAPAWPRWRITGPVLNPTVTINGDTANAWTVAYDLKTSDVIDINSRTGDVVLNQTQIRAGILRGELAPFYPGTSGISFAGDTYSATAQLRAWYRDSWK